MGWELEDSVYREYATLYNHADRCQEFEFRWKAMEEARGEAGEGGEGDDAGVGGKAQVDGGSTTPVAAVPAAAEVRGNGSEEAEEEGF